MQNINLFIKENVGDIGDRFYIAPNIPEKKLNNAIKAFRCEAFYESILAIYDNTIFGKSDEGLVFTGEKVIFKEDFEDPLVIVFSEMESVEYVREVKTNDKGKERVVEYTMITMKNGDIHKLTKPTLGDFNHESFTEFLNKIIEDFEDYKEEDQLKEIADMPNELKVAYLKVIVNMTFIDDERIDEKELSEIFLLITRLELDSQSRLEITKYINEISRDTIDTVESLIGIIKDHSEASHHKSLMISLVKDLINVYFSSKDTIDRDFQFLDTYRNAFGVSDEEIDLAYEAVENDYKILKEDWDDNAIERHAKELASKAAAAGVPLAAVYISGSVVGISAAGITSGLAALGMGMGMTGGLAVVGLIGVLSYKGMKRLTGANELDKYKTKELMLHDVIRQTQKTTSFLVQDINRLVRALNDVMVNHANDKAKIRYLVELCTRYQNVLSCVDRKSNAYQNTANRLQNPRILDEERLKRLTSDPTKKPLYEFILMNYEQQRVKIDGEVTRRYILKKDIPTDVLEKMKQVFKTLGYFEMGNIVTSKASSLVRGILG